MENNEEYLYVEGFKKTTLISVGMLSINIILNIIL